MNEEIRLLLVDDSSLARKMIRRLIEVDPKMVIVDEAVDGLDGLQKIRELDIDVVILDYEMPNMNGLELLKALARDPSIRHKPSVLICSSLTHSGSKHTINCLLAGAKDYVLKPDSTSNMAEVQKIILEKIYFAAKSQKKRPRVTNNSNIQQTIKPIRQAPIRLKNPGLVVIGSSTGGPTALEIALKDIPPDYPYPILIVQHMPANFTASLAASLTNNIQIPVIEVNKETMIEKGKAYLAAGGKHMLMKDPHTLDWEDGDLVNFCRPSVDVLFNSIAKVYKKSVLSIILTGMGDDGYKGIANLKKNLDCFSVIQDEASSVVWGMPRAVFDNNLHDMIVPIQKIGEQIINAKYASPIKFK